MKVEEAFNKLNTNKYFFHHVFGKKIVEFAEDYKNCFCANEFYFKENILVTKGIVNLINSLSLKFDCFLLVSKPHTMFKEDSLEIENGEGLLVKLNFDESNDPMFNYNVLSYQIIEKGVPIKIEAINEE